MLTSPSSSAPTSSPASRRPSSPPSWLAGALAAFFAVFLAALLRRLGRGLLRLHGLRLPPSRPRGPCSASAPAPARCRARRPVMAPSSTTSASRQISRRPTPRRYGMHVDGRQVAAAESTRVPVRAVGQHQRPSRPSSASLPSSSASCFVFGGRDRDRLDHVQPALARPRIERRPPGELAHLARHFRAIVARLRAEHRATATPVRRTGGARRAHGRCPSASTASGCRRRRSCASWSPPCPGAGWSGTP